MGTEPTAEAVLSVLMQDAKASIGDIAEEVGVSKPTVRKYITELEETGVIVGYSADVDPKKLADQTIALVGLEVESERYVDVIDALQSIEEIDELYTASGDHMVMATVRGSDGDAVGDLIQHDILTINGVTAAHPTFLQERLK